MRLKIGFDGAEYLLTTNRLLGFNQWGDPVELHASWPEKYTKTIFKWESVPNFDKGVAERVNTGPFSNSIVYTLPFTKENAQKLYDMRDGNNIQFSVKDESAGKVVGIKPQITLQDTFKLFAESDFIHLYNANYIPVEQKLLNIKAAEEYGILPPQTDVERQASIKAQQALSQKDKMASYG